MMKELNNYYDERTGKLATLYDNDTDYSVVTRSETGREDILFFESQISAYRYIKEWMKNYE
jgi:hypothetical protein